MFSIFTDLFSKYKNKHYNAGPCILLTNTCMCSANDYEDFTILHDKQILPSASCTIL